MTFGHPWFLLLLLLLPLAAWLKGKHGRPPAFLYSSVQLVRAVLNVTHSRSGAFLAALRWLTLALFIIALAQPRFSLGETRAKASGIDIIVALDRSSSMEAMDFELEGQDVDRLVMAKSVLRDFIAKRPNDRLGLIVFAGHAYVAGPLTLDHDFLNSNLDRIEIVSPFGAEDGTAIGDALTTSLNRLRGLKSKSKIVILMTDGQNTAGKVPPLTSAEAAQALGVKVYTIGVGTRGLAKVPVYNQMTRQKAGYQKQPVNIDEETLNAIADRTGGKYYRADNSERFGEIYNEIDRLEKTDAELKKYTDYQELFPWFISPGFGLLLVEIVLRHTLLRRLP